MPAIDIKSCADADCADPLPHAGGGNSWDVTFCICDGTDPSICTPGDDFPEYSGLGANADTATGLAGVYSTTCTTAGRSPSTTGGAGTWNSVESARSEDGSYATCPLDVYTAVHNTTQIYGLGSEYIVLKGFGFEIPAGATIVGIQAAIRAHSTPGSNSTVGIGCICNAGLTLGDDIFYFADPRIENSNLLPWLLPPTAIASDPYPSEICFTQGAYVLSETCAFGPDTNFGNAGGSTSSPNLDAIMPVKGLIFPASRPSDPDVTFTGCGVVHKCAGSGGSSNAGFGNGGGDLNKVVYLSTLKKGWTANEINDPSFGIAISFIGQYLSITAGAPTIFLNCAGIAVYYTGGNPVKRRQPNVCINT